MKDSESIGDDSSAGTSVNSPGMLRSSSPEFLRFLVVSNSVAALNIGGTFVLTQGVGLYYLISSPIAFGTALVAGFLLQKFWTFADKQVETLYWQVGFFIVIALTCIGINTAIVHLLVEYVGTHYLLAQLIGNLVIGGIKFLLYRFFLFGGILGRNRRVRNDIDALR